MPIQNSSGSEKKISDKQKQGSSSGISSWGKEQSKENPHQKPATSSSAPKKNPNAGYFPRMDEEEKDSGLITGANPYDHSEGSSKAQKSKNTKDIRNINLKDDDEDDSEEDEGDDEDTEGRRSLKRNKNTL